MKSPSATFFAIPNFPKEASAWGSNASPGKSRGKATRSIRATFNPACAVRIAAAEPAGPPPITSTSYLFRYVRTEGSLHRHDFAQFVSETKEEGRFVELALRLCIGCFQDSESLCTGIMIA